MSGIVAGRSPAYRVPPEGNIGLSRQFGACLERLSEVLRRLCRSPIVLARTLREPLVCWPKIRPGGAIEDAVVLQPGETVHIRENEERKVAGRMPVMVRDKIVYCNCDQFWNAVAQRPKT